jgi:leader peptidase (prepilin peptidase)/N-methyltransferase
VIPLPEALRVWAAAWAFAVGAAVGSFLNVVVARVPAGESVVRPGSRCPRCRTPIGWRDNLPVVSWLLLRGRCRRCRAPISWRYPLVELLGGLAALAAFARHGLSLAALAELAFAATLIALAFIDLDTWLLPHALTWPLLAAGLVLSAAGIAPAGGAVASAVGAGVGWGAFALIAVAGARLLGREALGWGDVWLLGGLGAWLGAPALLPVVLLASLQGTAVGLALILLGRSQPGPPPADVPAAGEPATAAGASGDHDDWVPPRHAVPFGPFLALGALEWLWGQEALARLVPTLQVFR